MTIELAVFVGVLVLLSLLGASLWRASRMQPGEFFPSQRARVFAAVRLRAGALLLVALLAVIAQYVSGTQRQRMLDQKEQRLLAYESEVQRLRIDYELLRGKLLAAAQVSSAPPSAPAAKETAAAAETVELAQIAVPRAVVRDRPAGRAQFTLTGGARVQLRGAPEDDSGRAWREAYTADGRRGWIAAEVLQAVKG